MVKDGNLALIVPRGPTRVIMRNRVASGPHLIIMEDKGGFKGVPMHRKKNAYIDLINGLR